MTPVAARLAGRLDLLDHPREYRVHVRPTPYLGGVALMLGFVGTILVLAGDLERTWPLIAGVALLAGVGTLDDRRDLSVIVRLLAEVLVAVGVWAAGLGWDLGAGGALDLATTVVWIVAVVNAFNLFDNMDGASSAMALVTAGATAIFGATGGDVWLTATGAALAGACLGFLPHNLARPSARIFLGDGGSMPLGFAVGVLTMVAATNAVVGWQALIIGLLLVGVPVVDTALVTFSRRRRSISILTGGRDHLTHRTNLRVRGPRRVAGVLGALQALVAALALFAVEGGTFAMVVLVLVFLAFAAALIVILEFGDANLGADGTLDGSAVQPRARALPGWIPDIPPVGGVAVGALGLGAGVTPFFLGLYDSSVWVPIGVAAVVLAAISALGHPPRLSTAGRLAVVGLGGLAAWALLSGGWAESAEQARIDGNRLIVLTAVLGVGLSLVGSDRLAAILAAGAAAGLLVVGVWVLVRMLGSDPGALFVDGRLHEPLQYVNAEGTGFLMGAFVALAAAERREPWVAGAGMGVATLFGGLLLLSQSRGVALAVAASVLLVVALVPGRLRRVWTLATLGFALLIASGPLLQIYDAARDQGSVPEAVAGDAAARLMLVSAVAGLAWAIVLTGHRRRTADTAERMRRAGTWLVAAVAVAGIIGAVASTGRLAATVDRQYDAFVEVGGPDAGSEGAVSRLTSGGGNRYDFWRVAWNTFSDQPLRGVGAGNYDRRYFAARLTDEDVRQPHSLPLQVLAELGLVGGALLATFFAGLALGAIRISTAARDSPTARLVAVASVGAVSAWAAQTTVDWIHLLPGTTSIALLLAGGLLRRRNPGPPTRIAGRNGRGPALRSVALAVGCACFVALAGASLARQGLSELYRDRALDALPQAPTEALRQSNRALRLDPEAVPSYYAKAAALARANAPEAAETVLLEAAGKEPSDFVTWSLLGDLSVRRGRLGVARDFYARALALNPRDPTLPALVDDPASALERTR